MSAEERCPQPSLQAEPRAFIALQGAGGERGRSLFGWQRQAKSAQLTDGSLSVAPEPSASSEDSSCRCHPESNREGFRFWSPHES